MNFITYTKSSLSKSFRMQATMKIYLTQPMRWGCLGDLSVPEHNPQLLTEVFKAFCSIKFNNRLFECRKFPEILFSWKYVEALKALKALKIAPRNFREFSILPAKFSTNFPTHATAQSCHKYFFVHSLKTKFLAEQLLKTISLSFN